jgi:hypothetical protein
MISCIFWFVLPVNHLHAFLSPPAFASRIHRPVSATSLQDAVPESETVESEEVTSIQVPMKFFGPYPTIGLRFPDLATANQKSQNLTGVSLDFILDTAANTNTINAQVANELELEVVGEAPPGVGSAGAISGGNTYMLGDSELEGTGKKPFTFMQGLTAAALPIASPACAGLLSQAFFYCFEGGVEFNWGSQSQSLEDGMIPNSASITFHGEKDANLENILSKLTRVPIEPVPVTQLPSVILKINGVEVPALLDTGSPITVLNSRAAQQAGIETITVASGPEKANNPFAAVANRFKAAQATSKAAANGDLLTIAGTNGQSTTLLKSTSAAKISLSGGSQDVSFGESNIYVGDIPGLAALNGIGVDSPPSAVLGMDVLRKRPKMLLRARDQEVYF